MDRPDYLFVYGTLRRGTAIPAQHALERLSTFSGTGTFRGVLYDLGPYPGACRSRNPKACVRGDLYRVHDPDRLFSFLDAYEGRLFRRERVTVRSATGARVRAWIYLYRGPLRGEAIIEGGDYLAHLARC